MDAFQFVGDRVVIVIAVNEVHVEARKLRGSQIVKTSELLACPVLIQPSLEDDLNRRGSDLKVIKLLLTPLVLIAGVRALQFLRKTSYPFHRV